MILIVFDIDGTLTDTNKVDQFCFAETYKQLHNVDWDNFNWDGVDHISDSGLANSYFLDEHRRLPTFEEIDALQNKFMSLMETEYVKDPSQFSEVKGGANLFQSLKDHEGYDVALATGCWERSAIFKLKSANIPFGGIPLGHADHHYDRGEITKKAIGLSRKKYKNKYEHVVYVGDGIWDAHTTGKLQIPFIGMDYHHNNKLKDIGTKILLHEYSSVEKFEVAINEAIFTFE